MLHSELRMAPDRVCTTTVNLREPEPGTWMMKGALLTFTPSTPAVKLVMLLESSLLTTF